MLQLPPNQCVLSQHGMWCVWRSTYNSFSPDFNSTFTFSEYKRLYFILNNFDLFVCECARVHMCVHKCMCIGGGQRTAVGVTVGSLLPHGPWGVKVRSVCRGLYLLSHLNNLILLKPPDYRDFELEFVYVCIHLFVHLLVKGRTLEVVFIFSFLANVMRTAVF